MYFNLNQLRPEIRLRLEKFAAEKNLKTLEEAAIFIWSNDSRIIATSGRASARPAKRR